MCKSVSQYIFSLNYISFYWQWTSLRSLTHVLLNFYWRLYWKWINLHAIAWGSSWEFCLKILLHSFAITFALPRNTFFLLFRLSRIIMDQTHKPLQPLPRYLYVQWLSLSLPGGAGRLGGWSSSRAARQQPACPLYLTSPETLWQWWAAMEDE